VKTIYLLRHAKSSWKDATVADFDRPLATRGKLAAEAIAAYISAHDILPGQILCSPSRRTRDTLQIIEQGLASAVPIRFEKAIYLAEAALLLRRLKRLSDSLSSVMVVGHNPGTEHLARMLTGAGDAKARDRLAEKYPTGALAVLSADVDHWGDMQPGCARLEDLVWPKDLKGA
jgi:phosphohistidine phosphatase